MRNIILFILGTFLLIPFNAYSQNEQTEIQTLIQRVDSLEHELSYFKLSYELNTLNYDISMFTTDVYTKALEVQMNFYNRNYYPGLAKSHQSYYESCERKMKSISDLIDAKKSLFTIKILTFPYSETEIRTLMSSYDVIDVAFDSSKNAMKLLKTAIEAYRQL